MTFFEALAQQIGMSPAEAATAFASALQPRDRGAVLNTCGRKPLRGPITKHELPAQFRRERKAAA